MTGIEQTSELTTQEAVISCLEENAQQWANLCDFDEQLALAAERAADAVSSTSLKSKHDYAIEAAARLIDAAHEMSRLLAAGEQ